MTDLSCNIEGAVTPIVCILCNDISCLSSIFHELSNDTKHYLKIEDGQKLTLNSYSSQINNCFLIFFLKTSQLVCVLQVCNIYSLYDRYQWRYDKGKTRQKCSSNFPPAFGGPARGAILMTMTCYNYHDAQIFLRIIADQWVPYRVLKKDMFFLIAILYLQIIS